MRVLLAGGAGSVGRAFVKLLHKDHQLTIVDNSEWACAELKHTYPDIETIVDDFDSERYKKHFNYIVVLAAYKHVELCEENVASCVDNNLTRLIRFYAGSIANGVLYFSTDKAVEPISVYGATKMIAERLTWSMGGSVARCGNFLNSSGSVIPVWEKAIEEGKPIPITDERMVRWVGETDEMVAEVWERFLTGEKLIVPEKMHEVRLMDLLSEVLKKHHYMNPEAYTPGVTIVGIRPGEKLQEKLKWDNERNSLRNMLEHDMGGIVGEDVNTKEDY